MSRIGVIGSGFAGLTSSAYLAKMGHDVTLYEKNTEIGGRARKFEDRGFSFDMGPSWYWMPEVFDKFFKDFGSRVEDHYELVRLSPSYRVFFEDNQVDVPAGRTAFVQMAEMMDPGSGVRVERFLKEAAFKYQTSMSGFVQKPSLSFTEFLHPSYMVKALRLNMFKSLSKHLDSVTNHPGLRSILEFPSLFLGETPKRIPALYSIMNHADIDLGTWYPMGGMHIIIEGFSQIAKQQGVEFKVGHTVDSIEDSGGIARIHANGKSSDYDFIVSGADYAHTEQLLDANKRMYSESYWDNRSFAPSCLIYYVGVNKVIPGLKHHNLFFDADFADHSKEIYSTHKWPSNPLFYVCCPSKTDPSVAPEGSENLFILIPVSTEIEDTTEVQERYFDMVMERIEKRTGMPIRNYIAIKKSYARSNFISDYNAYKGNAYGLANTLRQTAFLKPKMQSTKFKNLYFTGQLTVPGPGVPPAIISGETVAKLVNKHASK